MLSKETVEHVAKLARLKLSEEEILTLSHQLSAVLENFQQLAQVDTQGFPPLFTATDMPQNLRIDVAERVADNEAVLQNAQEKVGRLFKVPPVV